MRHWTGKRNVASPNRYDAESIGMTGLCTIDQRYYASSYGRFNTADPFNGSARTISPLSWNRYSYTRGDPVNHADPQGLVETASLCDGEDGDCGGGGGGDDGEEGVNAPGVTAWLDDSGNPVFSINDDGKSSTTSTDQDSDSSDDDSDGVPSDPEPEPDPGQVPTFTVSVNSCVAGAAALGSTVGAGFGGSVFGAAGGVLGGVGGTTVPNYPNAAGLPSGNTAEFMVTGILNDLTGVTTTTATRIGNNLGGLPEVIVPNSACQITVVCVSPFRGIP
jgi:RHS repeat-associated protein